MLSSQTQDDRRKRATKHLPACPIVGFGGRVSRRSPNERTVTFAVAVVLGLLLACKNPHTLPRVWKEVSRSMVHGSDLVEQGEGEEREGEGKWMDRAGREGKAIG